MKLPAARSSYGADCAAPVDIEGYYGTVIPPGAYSFLSFDSTVLLVFDIPEGVRLEFFGLLLVERSVDTGDTPRGSEAVSFKDPNSETYFSLDLVYGGEFGRVFDPGFSVGGAGAHVRGATKQALDDAFDLMAGSTWHDNP